MYTDTHCHITCDELFGRKEEIIDNALKSQVETMMIMCTSQKELERALCLKKEHPDIFKVAFGYYPGDARDVTDQQLQNLELLALEGKLDVLGEIGLDYYWDKSFAETQKELFKKQILIANKAGLPISIHMREASRDTMDLLKEFARTPVILHCFSGSREIMEEAVKRGYYISFAGPVTYKNNKQGPVNVENCPMEFLLSETDSPYLSPVPKRGKQNEPANVIYTTEKIAEIKNMPVEEVCRCIQQNFKKIFDSRRNTEAMPQ